MKSEFGEELREQFETAYGKTKSANKGVAAAGHWLDLNRLPNGDYRSMVTYFAWKAYRDVRNINGNLNNNSDDDDGHYL